MRIRIKKCGKLVLLYIYKFYFCSNKSLNSNYFATKHVRNVKDLDCLLLHNEILQKLFDLNM